MTNAVSPGPSAAPETMEAPSAWIVRFSGLLAPGARLLDVACGSGRHLRWFAGRGHPVTGVDRDAAALEPLRHLGEMVVADLEAGPWPFAGRSFGAIVVSRYLWRPLLPILVASLEEGGVLLYETFARGQESVGRPANPDFLLRPGELLTATAGLRVIAFEDGFLPEAPDGPDRFVQRIAAVREPAAAPASPAPPRRYPLT